MSNWKVTGNPQVLRADCPDCGDDAKGHLYFYLASMSSYCFRCSTYSSRRRLKELFGEDLPESSEDLSSVKSLDQAVGVLRGKDTKDELPEIELPESVPAWGDKRSRGYLKSRGVPLSLVLLHNIRYCREGMYRNRVILPAYCRGKVRTFSARDIIGNQSKKYLFPPGVFSGHVLFNLDNVRHSKMVVVVEGQFDAMHLQKFRIPAVATFGKKLTLAQQELLQKFERVIILFDNDAFQETYRYMRGLSQAEAAFLPKEDPTSFNQRELIYMLRHRFGKIEAAAQILRFA